MSLWVDRFLWTPIPLGNDRNPTPQFNQPLIQYVQDGFSVRTLRIFAFFQNDTRLVVVSIVSTSYLICMRCGHW